jgi:hypothetical protein
MWAFVVIGFAFLVLINPSLFSISGLVLFLTLVSFLAFVSYCLKDTDYLKEKKLSSQFEKIKSKNPKEVISEPSTSAAKSRAKVRAPNMPRRREGVLRDEFTTCPECEDVRIELKWSGKLRCLICHHQWWNVGKSTKIYPHHYSLRFEEE